MIFFVKNMVGICKTFHPHNVRGPESTRGLRTPDIVRMRTSMAKVVMSDIFIREGLFL